VANFPSIPLGETFARGLPGNQNPLWVAPSLVQKLKHRGTRRPHVPPWKKKAALKSNLNRSISNGAQYVTLDSIKCPSLTFCFLATPTNKTVYAGTTNSKPLDKSEIPSHSQVQFITLFLGAAQLCCAFYWPPQAARIWWRKTNSLS
jgi:hypothetical protein